MAKNSTKHQKKLRKKEKRKQERLELIRAQKRGEDTKKVIKYGGLSLVVIVAAFLIYSNRPNPETTPFLKISPESFSIGDASVSKGTVSTNLKIENTGKVDLILTDMETSCACTTASVIYEGIDGPIFGMRGHGTNPKNWKVTIKPGGIATLKVNYDPTVHFDLRGPVTRTISIYSNDPRNSVKNIYLTANQVD